MRCLSTPNHDQGSALKGFKVLGQASHRSRLSKGSIDIFLPLEEIYWKFQRVYMSALVTV